MSDQLCIFHAAFAFAETTGPARDVASEELCAAALRYAKFKRSKSLGAALNAGCTKCMASSARTKAMGLAP